MIVNKTETTPKFQPFKLEITVETLQEQLGLFCIFNHAANASFLRQYHVPVESLTTALNGELNHNKHHCKLHDEMRKYFP